MEERIAMFREFDTGVFTVSEIAGRYGVSRETFYYWQRRRDSGDERWFEDRSRAPGRCPHAISNKQTAAIIAMRKRFPHFGPKKIRAKLMAERPKSAWPAASTTGDILKREGLIKAKKRRQSPIGQDEIVAGSDTANGEWSIDFKGWFRTSDGTRCDPLTIADTASRYLITVSIVDPTWAGVRCAMERVFDDIGLPEAIRSDNGPPFGSCGAGGLSSLSVWFLKLGIEPRYIPPASPQDNGRHERMHRTLKAETSKPPAATPLEQQARFDAFCKYYNEERPHEALGQTSPAVHWQPSVRRLPGRTDEPWYDADHEVRNVRRSGDIKWRGRHIFIGEALAGEPVGLCELDTDRHIVRFCGRDLGVINEKFCFLRFAPPRARLRKAEETKRE